MEITSLQRRITFGLIVFVLVALGAYLIRPAAHGSGSPGKAAGRPHPPPASSPRAAPSSPSPAATSAQAVSPDIYQWLPFTQSGLAAAVSRARQFGAAYGTFSYTQTPAAYIAPIAPLTSAQLAAQIKAAY